MEERRKGGRCPTCQGPMTTNEINGKLRCRNSHCAFNHKDVSCPRCGASEIEVAGRSAGRYSYTCSNCLHRFNGPGS